MNFAILTTHPPFLGTKFGGWGGGSKFGWPVAAIVRRFGFWSRSTFFFYTDPGPDPPTNDGVAGAIFDCPRSAPYGAPPSWTFRGPQAWLKNRNFGVNFDDPRRPLGRFCASILVLRPLCSWCGRVPSCEAECQRAPSILLRLCQFGRFSLHCLKFCLFLCSCKQERP